MVKKASKYPFLSMLLKEGFFMFWLQVMAGTQTPVIAQHKIPTPTSTPVYQASQNEILQDSQISYRAEGGFTGVRSYTVIITCVDGKISTLQSIHDPRVSDDERTLYRTGKISSEAYLNLWNNLNKQAVFNLKDGENPKMEIMDEFTVQFEVKAGSRSNTFKVYGCNRPEAARFHAVKCLLDQAVDMRSLWSAHSRVAKK